MHAADWRKRIILTDCNFKNEFSLNARVRMNFVSNSRRDAGRVNGPLYSVTLTWIEREPHWRENTALQEITRAPHGDES